MKHRWAELLASETIAAAATRQPIDLKALDPISRLSILVKLTNNGSVPTDHPAKAIVNAKIIDGSDVLMSLNGMEIQATDFYDNKGTPFHDNIFLNDVMNLAAYHINFGRWLHDPLLAFDPSKFKNPQLVIQHNLAAGGSAPDSMDLRVRADVFDNDAPPPSGYLMTKEHYSYSLVSSGNEVIELPLDHPIRKIILLSRAAAKAPHEQYNLIKLSEEEDKKVIAEIYTSDLIKVLSVEMRQWLEKIFGNATAAGVAHFVTPTFAAYPSLNAEGTNAQIYAEAFVNGGTKTIYGDVTSNFHGLYSGLCPHGAVPIELGDPNDIEDWWDVTRLQKAKLKITAGSSIEASSTAQIITQQLRKY